MKSKAAKFLIFLASAGFVAGGLSASADAPPQPKAWTPPAAMMSQLAAPVKIGSWSIQPPTGYTEIKRPSPDGSGDIYSWVGPKHDTHIGASVGIIVAIPPKGQEHTYTTDQILVNLLDNLHNERLNWKQTPTELGTINGQQFEHVTWQASDAQKGTVSHGFDYATQLSDGTFLMIVSEDIEPYNTQTLPLTDASALTFKAK